MSNFDDENQTNHNRNHSYKKYRLYKFISYAALALVVLAAAGFVFGAIIMFLWNSTIAEVFSVSSITLWQAIGLYFLAKLFFGFGSGSGKMKKNVGRFRWAKFRDGSVRYKEFQEFWDQEGREAYKRFQKGDNSSEASQN